MELKNRHRDMMMSLVYDGLTQFEVASKYGISEGRMSILRRSPLWQLEEREMRTQFLSEKRRHLETLLPKAINALERNLESNNPNAEIAAAKEILNRGGLPANVVVETFDRLDPSVMYETIKDIQAEKAAVLKDLNIESVEELFSQEEPIDV